MSRIFISYKRADKEKVFKIKNQIESTLGEKCWIDIDGICDSFEIIDAINKCEIVLLMYSKTHAQISDFEKDWAVKELMFARSKRKRIVIINIDGSPLSDEFDFLFALYKQIDGQSSEALNRLCNDLKEWLWPWRGKNEEFYMPSITIDSPKHPYIEENKLTYAPQTNNRKSFWMKLFGINRKRQDVYSSVFAPSEVKPKSRMMVQVYLHLNDETEMVKALATEADKNAERRDYIPLQTKLKKGDKVDVVLNINSDRLLYDSSKSIIWQGSFCKCAFDYLVPSDLSVDELSCSVTLSVNGAFIGEMLFYTQIVYAPTQLNAKVIANPVKKLFISYSHNDLKSAEKIAKIHEALGIDVFFDKHRLKSGYIYSEEILNFISKADTFVLCWSENAAQSEYVEKERKAALKLAYPNYRPREDAPIRIKPYNIQPYATPPKDMIEHYHFEEL